MSEPTYKVGQTVNILDEAPPQTGSTPGDGKFAALVKVIGSRYGVTTYPPETGWKQKITIEWTMVSTNNKPFFKNYSTGIEVDTVASISEDKKRLIVKGEGFQGIKGSSDGIYLLQTAIAAGFPKELITDDISVFEGHCFFIATSVNPRWQGSKEKPYPKQYHAEGFEKALANRFASKAAQQATTATSSSAPTSVYKVPQVVATDKNILEVAGTTLMEILVKSGGKVSRNEIPNKLNDVVSGKSWATDDKFRQNVYITLWDLPKLTEVVEKNAGLKITGDVVSFK